MTTRIGKIARLPREIREELNKRLDDGLDAPAILPWLNSLPEVQSVLAARFASMPVNEPNLSAWRTGGYQDWLRCREAKEFIGTLDEDPPSGPESDQDPESPPRNHTHKLMCWLAIQYAAAAADLSSMEESEERWNRLRQLCADLARLRSADLRAESIRIENERLANADSQLARQERQDRLRALTGAFGQKALALDRPSPDQLH